MVQLMEKSGGVNSDKPRKTTIYLRFMVRIMKLQSSESDESPLSVANILFLQPPINMPPELAVGRNLIFIVVIDQRGFYKLKIVFKSLNAVFEG